MYYNNGMNSCCSNTSYPMYGYQPYPCCCGGNNSSYAVVLVLFILLVIVIGSRWNR